MLTKILTILLSSQFAKVTGSSKIIHYLKIFSEKKSITKNIIFLCNLYNFLIPVELKNCVICHISVISFKGKLLRRLQINDLLPFLLSAPKINMVELFTVKFVTF